MDNSIHNNNNNSCIDNKKNNVVTWKKINEASSGFIIFEKQQHERVDENYNNNNNQNDTKEPSIVKNDVDYYHDDNNEVNNNSNTNVDDKEKKKYNDIYNNNNNRLNNCQQQHDFDNDNERIIEQEMYNQFEENGYIICRNVFNPNHIMNEWNVSFTTPYNWKRTNHGQQQTYYNNDDDNDEHNNNDNDEDVINNEHNCTYSLSNYMELFYDIFHYLYERKYISFPFDRRIIRCCDEDNNEERVTLINDVTSTSDIICHTTETSTNNAIMKSTIEYSLGIGIKNGFYEIVMRSYGRYEISLLNLIHRQQQRKRQRQQQQNYDATTTTNTTTQRTTSQHSADTIHHNNNNNDYLNQCFPFLHEIQKELFFIPSLLQSKQQQQNSGASNNKENNWNNDENKDIIMMKKKWTWDGVRIIHMSLIISTPGSVEQTWHSDGGHVDLLQHLNCHVLNIFIPIINMISNDIGLTELRPKSHYYTRDLMKLLLLATIKKQIISSITPYLYIGDILIFDYRILHRGKANTTMNTNRTYLVITVAQSWFHDTLNFPSNSIFD